MTREEMITTLKEIATGKDGQPIPYNIITKGIQPLVEAGCLLPAIYLLECITTTGYSTVSEDPGKVVRQLLATGLPIGEIRKLAEVQECDEMEKDGWR